MIKQIIEKYVTPDDPAAFILYEEDFPALTAELETLMREEACKFSEWQDKNNWRRYQGLYYQMHIDPHSGKTTAELYEQFKQTKEQ